MIKFYKVSLEQWKKDCKARHYDKTGKEDIIPLIEGADEILYEQIKIPKRATKGSAGYDIYSLFTFVLYPGETIYIPTGLRVQMDNDTVFMIYPRSGLGFKYRFQLDNTCGIIDSDYFNSDNEGHIFVKMTNCGHGMLEVEKGDAICQGIFMKYLLTDDDDTTGERNGGLGSTDKK